MAQIAIVSWKPNRAARVVEQGPEQTIIEWLDTGEEQTVITSEIEIKEVLDSVADITKKHKIKKAGPTRPEQTGPTKQDLATAIVRKNPGESRAELISIIMQECEMSKAGATTYYYNAKKAIATAQQQEK